MSEKTTLLSGAEEEFAQLKQAIGGLSEAQMREAWLGTWGVREIVSHMSGWHREIGPALERLWRGEKPIADGVSYEDVDGWNARFAEAKRAWPTPAIMKELEASHGYFMKAAAGVPEERYVPGKTAYKLVDLNSRHHYQEHRQQIEDWRKGQGV